MNDTPKPALPEPTRPNESGSTPVLARWMLETSAGWLAAHDKEAFATYADQCTAAAQARIAELNALLTDARDMLTILAKRYTLTILDNDSVREVLSDLNAALASTSGAEPTALEDTPCPGCNGPRSAGPCCEDCSWQDKPRAASPPVVQPEATIDTADHVLHRPTGETWVVAFAENGRVCACGWPCTLVPVSDCELTKKATPAERDKLLREIARMGGSDVRKDYAVRALAAKNGAPNA